MRVLLDTHTFLWAISDDARLGAVSRSLIFDQAERVLLSHISLWEIAIKHALARADMPVSAAEASSWADASGFELLPWHLSTSSPWNNSHSITAIPLIACWWRRRSVSL